MKLAIGIIGTGFGKMMAQTFKAVDPECEVYLSGRDHAKTEQIATEIGAAGTYKTWQSLVQDPKIGLVVIAAPNAQHQQMFMLAVASRKHILLEKAAAPTAAEIADMQKLAKNYPRLIVVNHEARFHPAVSALKQLIIAQKLGTVLTVRLGAYLNMFTDPNYHGSWYTSKAEGGGQLLAMGTHQLDLARFLLSMPGIVSGNIHASTFADPRFEKPADVETQFTAQFMTDTGVNIDMFNDTYCFGYKDMTIEVIGSKGIALYSDAHGLRTSFSNSEPPAEVNVRDDLASIQYGSTLFRKAFKFAAREILASIEHNKLGPELCTLDDAKDTLAIIEHATQRF
jgi:predicted dehydrogenase